MDTGASGSRGAESRRNSNPAEQERNLLILTLKMPLGKKKERKILPDSITCHWPILEVIGMEKACKTYAYLKEQYPEVITLEQLYRICHISKRKGKWMLENRVIPCQDSGKKTRRFKIKLDDVIAYLEKEAAEGRTVIPAGIFSAKQGAEKQSECQKLILRLNNPEIYQEIYWYYEKKYRKAPDALDANAVADLTGFGTTAVHGWIRAGHLKVYRRVEQIIPKAYLLDFLCTPYYVSICNRSSKHRETILYLQKIVKKYTEGG